MSIKIKYKDLPVIPSHTAELIHPREVPEPFRMFHIQTQYVNSCPIPITIVSRDGMKCHIDPTPVGGEPGLIIYKTINVPAYNSKNFINYVKNLSPNVKGIMRLIRDEIVRYDIHPNAVDISPLVFVIKQFFKYEHLHQLGGETYNATNDIVISVKDPNSCSPHPYWQETIHPYHDYRFMCEGQESFSYQVVLNNAVPQTYYAYGFGQVYTLRSARVPHMEDGLYLCSHYSELSVPHHMTIEKAIADGILYHTQHDAVTGGKPELKHKAQLVQLQQQLELTKIKVAETKQKAEAEKILLRSEAEVKAAELRERTSKLEQEYQHYKYQSERIAVQQKFQEEREKAELESEIRNLKFRIERAAHHLQGERQVREQRVFHEKAEVEEKTIVRKDKSDGLKFILGTVTTIVAIGAALWKIFF